MNTVKMSGSEDGELSHLQIDDDAREEMTVTAGSETLVSDSLVFTVINTEIRGPEKTKAKGATSRRDGFYHVEDTFE